jgi:superfamily II DNA or RNA helicase
MSSKKANKKKVVEKVSHLIKPPEMTLDQWQIVLRKQIARASGLRIQNVGNHPVFSDFKVNNPTTKKSYRVFIGGESSGMSYCSCSDFAVNALGTCKHIESVLYRLRRDKKNRSLLEAGWHPEQPAVSLRYGLKRQVVFLPGREMSDRLRVLVSEYFKDGLLAEHGFYRFDEFRQEVEKLKEKVNYHEDTLSFIAQARDKNILSEMIEKNFPKGVEDPQWDNFCKIGLYAYQRQGALFAAANGRVLIADEMGLGKTIQAIAAAELMARFLGIDRVLVICPASLKHQWKAEIEKTVNRKVQIIGGPLLERRKQYQEESFFKIINYDVVRRDTDVIPRLNPDLIILDEAQRIKNWKTRLAQSVKHLESPYAIVLTGTPLENRLEELHSIVEFIDRHHLGPLFRFLNHHQLVNEEGRMMGYKNLNDLGKSLEKIMIRRNRREVLEQLPGRVDKNYFVPMTPDQVAIHEEYRELVARLVRKWRRCHFLTEEEKQRLMMALQKMRMVCNSTYLIDETTDSGNKINELETQLGEILENPETKIVLFSQWLRTMDLIIRFLNRRKWKYVFLHGGVPSIKRGDLIEKFREDKNCRIFLSTEAGGLGLNLQQASFVINMDLPWNPAVLEQRIGRAHRMGQKNVVRVINFIAENSIEHSMLGLLKFKKSVFSGVLDEGEDQVLMGESRFNQFIKTVEGATEEIDKVKEAAIVEPAPVSSQKNPLGTSSPPSSLPLFIKMAGDFLQKISETMQSAQEERFEDATHSSTPLTINRAVGGIRLHTDQATGRKSLHIPLPDDRTLNHLAQVLGKIFNEAK